MDINFNPVFLTRQLDKIERIPMDPDVSVTKTPLVNKIVVILIIMSTIAGTITGIMTWANLGFSEAFVSTWGKSFVTALVVMMPISGVLIVIFSAVVTRVFPTQTQLRQNLIIGLLMSIGMQSIMALITAFTAVGIENMERYRFAWTEAFTTAFPVGLALGLLLTAVIKPRVMAYVKT